jgi:hypothetical protein
VKEVGPPGFRRIFISVKGSNNPRFYCDNCRQGLMWGLGSPARSIAHGGIGPDGLRSFTEGFLEGRNRGPPPSTSPGVAGQTTLRLGVSMIPWTFALLAQEGRPRPPSPTAQRHNNHERWPWVHCEEQVGVAKVSLAHSVSLLRRARWRSQSYQRAGLGLAGGCPTQAGKNECTE